MIHPWNVRAAYGAKAETTAGPEAGPTTTPSKNDLVPQIQAESYAAHSLGDKLNGMPPETTLRFGLASLPDETRSGKRRSQGYTLSTDLGVSG